jgi:HTH-type transcriptional repressor of NAD biosynthesis genes
MKYKCGIYGGTFNPLHMGHVRCIIEAANQCEKLIIVISDGINRNELNIKIRYRWIYQLTKHLSNVSILIIKDESETKEGYTEEMWTSDAIKVKDFAGDNIDVVFCGSDYDSNSFWPKCYPDSEIIYFPRNQISSSKIRSNPTLYWDWLPNVVKPYYVKKVLVIGGESTGKSTLVTNLAHYYNTNYLEEVGRDISERSGSDLMMIPDDFTDILLMHKTKEKEAIITSNRLLFEDTDCLITKFYIRFLEGKQNEDNEALADIISSLNRYDLILFLEPDVKFVQDGGRSTVIEEDRVKYSNKIKDLYSEKGFNFEIISGNYQERFLKSINLIDTLLEENHYENN